MKDLLKNPNIIRITISILIIAIVIYFIVRKYRRNRPPKNIKAETDDGGTLKDKSLTEYEAKRLVERLAKDLYDTTYNWLYQSTNRDLELYKTLNSMSDKDLIIIANLWDSMYYSKHNEKLWEAIDNEYMWFVPFNSKELMRLLKERLKEFDNYR